MSLPDVCEGDDTKGASMFDAHWRATNGYIIMLFPKRPIRPAKGSYLYTRNGETQGSTPKLRKAKLGANMRTIRFIQGLAENCRNRRLRTGKATA